MQSCIHISQATTTMHDVCVTCRVWSVASGACLHELKGHTERVSCVALSADGGTLVSGSGDATLRCVHVHAHTGMDGWSHIRSACGHGVHVLPCALG